MLRRQIPDKGRILTAMSVFFFDHLDAPNHLAGPPDDPRIPEEVLGRALLVRRLEMLPVECVARGYLTGSGLRTTRKPACCAGSSCRQDCSKPASSTSRCSPRRPKPNWDEHDENISLDDVARLVGLERALALRDLTLRIYLQAADHALRNGIIVADTKFEFGVDEHGDLVLADEVFTPDSSRYWPADEYRAGVRQHSFDKQFVRNWLIGRAPDGTAMAATRRHRCRPTSWPPPAPVISRLTNVFRA